MKIVLSNKIYLKPDEELKERLQKQLTYEIIDPQATYPRYVSHFGQVAGDVYWMPNTRLDLLKGIDLEIVDKRISVPAEIPEPEFTLRSDQAEICEDVDGDCIINGAPGFGKTISALFLAFKFQQKTLVVCTNTNIRAMWEKEIKKWFGFTPGVIGGGKYETDPPIVVANIQTVRKYGSDLSDKFGLLIVDEAHHCVAATFELLVMFSKAKIKVGLTGTLWRKDGLHVCFSNFFGNKVYTPAENNTLPPTIHMYELDCEIPGGSDTPWALRVNELYKDPEYFHTVKALANAYAKLGHKVLVVNDRVEMLEEWNKDNQVDSYIITGNVDMDDRLEIMDTVADAVEPAILWATQSIFAEGVSLDELSCVILATPTNNKSLVEQIAGRIQRIAAGKELPVVVDLGLQGNTGRRHKGTRKGIYQGRGWEMIRYTKKRLGLELKEKINSQEGETLI